MIRKISKSHELLLHWLTMIRFTQYITLFNDCAFWPCHIPALSES